MPLSLICACGARIELEDAMAGQEIACPECQQPLKAPAGAAQNQPVRTSAFALASLVLAVTGAFTIVGTLAAVVLGLVAVVRILRQRDRLAGLGFAIAGIVVGVIFTVLTLVAFSTAEPLGLASYVREQNMAPAVDTTGPLEVTYKDWTITRPTEKWGVARNGQVNDPIGDLFIKKEGPDVVLAEIKRYAFVDVRQESNTNNEQLEKFLSRFLDEYKSADPNIFNEDPKSKEEGLMRITNGKQVPGGDRVPSSVPSGCQGREAEMDVQAAGQKWALVVRVYHNPQTKRFYILRAYTPRRLFKDNKVEIEKALDSFRIVK